MYVHIQYTVDQVGRATTVQYSYVVIGVLTVSTHVYDVLPPCNQLKIANAEHRAGSDLSGRSSFAADIPLADGTRWSDMTGCAG